MPPVKSLDRISEKWSRQSQASEKSYAEGIENPRADWADQTAKAAGAYESGVTQAISNKSFEKGVRAAGTNKWQENSRSKGPGRWSQGVRLSKAAYERGFAPFRQVLENLTLPPRGPKGDPGNIDRVRVVAEALHNAKVNRTS